MFFSYVKNEQAANKKWKKLTGSEWFSEYEDGYEVTFFSFVYFHFLSIHKFLIVCWFGCFPLNKSDSFNYIFFPDLVYGCW